MTKTRSRIYEDGKVVAEDLDHTALLEHLQDDRCVVWVETCAAATRHDALKGDVLKTQQAWLDTLIEVLEDGTEDGSFPDVTSVTDTAELLVRVIDGFMLDAALADSDPPDDAGHRRRVALLRRAATHIVGV